MKYLLLIAIVGFVLWMMRTKSRPPAAGGSAAPPKAKVPEQAPLAMLACVHCGVHLPQSDVVADAAGRPYCSEPHRLAGPR